MKRRITAIGVCLVLLVLGVLVPAAIADPMLVTTSYHGATFTYQGPGPNGTTLLVWMEPQRIDSHLGSDRTEQTKLSYGVFISTPEFDCIVSSSGYIDIDPVELELDAPYKTAHLQKQLIVPDQCRGSGDMQIDVDVTWDSNGVAHSFQAGDNFDKTLGTASGVVTVDSAAGFGFTLDLGTVAWNDHFAIPMAWIYRTHLDPG